MGYGKQRSIIARPPWRWLLAPGTLLLALVAASCAIVGSPASGGPIDVTVTATEFKLDPALVTVPAGRPVRLTFINRGTVEHDWEAKGLLARDVRVLSTPPNLARSVADEVRTKAEQGIPHPMAGPRQQMVVEFTPVSPGSFDIVCEVPGHKEAGMVARLEVTGEAAAQPASDGRASSGAVAVPARGNQIPGPAVALPVSARLAQAAVAPPIGVQTSPRLVPVEIEAKEVVGLLDEDVSYGYWTFGGTVPGPMLRVRQGDTVELTLSNAAANTMTHSIDLHAVTGPGGGARVTAVAPGEQATFRFQALNPGAYVYHCAAPVVSAHIANGMYGLIMVEPPEGLPPVDREFYVMQGDIYLEGARGAKGQRTFSMEKLLDERPDYVVFNGASGALVGDRALTARVGETVRIFFGVGGPNLTSSFHVIGEIFDRAYPEGASEPVTNLQTTLVPAGGATIVEFRAEVPGTYVLVDHSLGRLEKGAAAQLVVEGPENPALFESLSHPAAGHPPDGSVH